MRLEPALASLRDLDLSTKQGLADLLPEAAVQSLAGIEGLPAPQAQALAAQVLSAYQQSAVPMDYNDPVAANEPASPAAARKTLAFAEETAQRLSASLPVHAFKLDNGLSVVVSPDHASPTVAVALTYKAGSQLETPGLSGFFHLFEHLMAQGTKNLKPREISKLIEHNGGMRNASTNKTITKYYSLVPRPVLNLVLWAEADRMDSLDVNARALALEKQVVLEEMRRNYLNAPYRLASTEAMGKAAFSKWRNQHSTIGDAADIRNARLEDVRAVREAHYAPNNAVLSLVGDVTLAEAQVLVKRYFGHIQPRRIPRLPNLIEPPLKSDVRVEALDPMAKLPKLLVGWHLPKRGSKDFWALYLLSEILSGGETNPLYQALVKGAETALSAGAGAPWWSHHYALRGPELFGLDILMKLESPAEEVLAGAEKVLARFADKGPTQEELTRAKMQTEFSWFNGLQSPMDRAELLGAYAAMTGSPKRLARDLKDVLSLTAQDLRDAARRWIRGKGRAIVHIVPAPAQPPAAEPATSPIPEETPRSPVEKPPALEAARPTPVPELHRFTLSNGLKVLFARDKRLPLLEVRLSLPSGEIAEGPGEAGVSDAAGSLLFKGTREQDAAAIAKAISDLGWSKNVGNDAERTLVSAAGLARNAAPFFQQLARVLSGANYPEAELSLWKRNMAKKLESLRFEPDFMTKERRKAELFPGHPYGKPFLDEAALAKLDSATLAAFHARAVGPQGASLVIVGDMEPAAVQEMLDKALGSWKGTGLPSDIPPLPDSGRARLILIDRPGSRQVNVTLSQAIAITAQDPDYLPFMVMNHILGGSATSRLILNLRTDKGYTYGSYSRVANLSRGAAWSANAEVREEVALKALQEMQKEVRRLRDEPVPFETLEAARRNLAGIFAIRLISAETKADYLAKLEKDGADPAVRLKEYLPLLEALTPEDIQRVARRYLDPEKIVTIAVGDKATLEPILKPYVP